MKTFNKINAAFITVTILMITALCSAACARNNRMPAEQAEITNTLISTVVSRDNVSTTKETTTTAVKDETSTVIATTEIETTSKVKMSNLSFTNAKSGFKITVYTPGSDGGRWGYATATGAKSTHLATCAVDPSVIPLGSTVKVNGLTLKAVDTGSAVKGNHIDIFFDGSDSEARAWISSFGDYSEDISWTK